MWVWADGSLLGHLCHQYMNVCVNMWMLTSVVKWFEWLVRLAKCYKKTQPLQYQETHTVWVTLSDHHLPNLQHIRTPVSPRHPPTRFSSIPWHHQSTACLWDVSPWHQHLHPGRRCLSPSHNYALLTGQRPQYSNHILDCRGGGEKGGAARRCGDTGARWRVTSSEVWSGGSGGNGQLISFQV